MAFPSGGKGCGWKNAVHARIGQLAQSIIVKPGKYICSSLWKGSNFVNYVFCSEFLPCLSFQYVVTNRKWMVWIFINICMKVYMYIFVLLMIVVTEVKAISPFITLPSSLVLLVFCFLKGIIVKAWATGILPVTTINNWILVYFLLWGKISSNFPECQIFATEISLNLFKVYDCFSRCKRRNTQRTKLKVLSLKTLFSK